LGFADPSKMDMDSTIQEANIAYPSDAQLMVKMTLLVNKVWTYMKENVSFFADLVVYLCAADKSPRLTRRPSQEQKILDERVLIATQRPFPPS
jgi:hypothetical protein